MGCEHVSFASKDASNPAKFFILSCPAHSKHPTTVATRDQATTVALGTKATANERVIRQYIHENGIQSCQLVMGFTEFAEGSVWNTFPPHTHNRRSEVYFYFDMEDRVLAHFMGEATATRHLFIQDEQAVISPSWSIHRMRPSTRSWPTSSPIGCSSMVTRRQPAWLRSRRGTASRC
jgi:4-deoxy-L-threo-5-hexosulose-uronate ketol-isomerase